jgi:hypothetical protein
MCRRPEDDDDEFRRIVFGTMMAMVLRLIPSLVAVALMAVGVSLVESLWVVVLH